MAGSRAGDTFRGGIWNGTRLNELRSTATGVILIARFIIIYCYQNDNLQGSKGLDVSLDLIL